MSVAAASAPIPYVAHLLALGSDEAAGWLDRFRRGDKRGAPGMVRISFGFYNDVADIHRLLDALRWIIDGDIAGMYQCDEYGEYRPVGHVAAVG